MFRAVIIFFLATGRLHAQAESIDSVLTSQFTHDFEAMVDELEMSDSIEVAFRIIYNEYGVVMKEAYENRTTWTALGHTYEWASRDRDTKLKVILNSEQLNLFKKRQKEIERAARDRKKELTE